MTVALVLLVLAIAALAVVAMRIRARAIRRCGELLKEIPAKPHGPGGKPGGGAHPHLASAPSERAQAAAAAGLSPDQTKDALASSAPTEPPPAPALTATDEPPATVAVPPRAATLGEAHVLARLFAKPATAHDLAAALGCSPRWIRACLQHLEAGGYATKIGELWVATLALDDLRRALGPAASS